MPTSALETLIELSKIDIALARIHAEKKQIEQALTQKETTLKRLTSEVAALSKSASERRARYLAEDKAIKEEKEKIEERKKALNTLHNYKLQQAAIREIEYQGRQLKVREDTLLKLLDDADQSEAAFKKADQQLTTLKDDCSKLRAESGEGLAALEKRRVEQVRAREAALPKVLPANLQQYDRVRARFPENPMVPITNGSCSGCYIQVAAQLMVNVHKGDALVKCRGCGRFIYLDPASSDVAAA
jgi:predicted  nucleic acid-binding Zn-ribbon protein